MSIKISEFISGLKTKQFTKVIVASGAGISVAAGLRDYRSKDTGLYDQLKKNNMTHPEKVYDIHVFRKNPDLYYQVCREFGTHNLNLKPTVAHQFIKLLDDSNQLLYCFTQNIDGLELTAGVRNEKVIQVHGHRRSASCIDCDEKYPIKEFYQNVDKGVIARCLKCSGLVKPDVVFFGQKLPQIYFDKLPEVSNSDLIIVMGTSLAVHPFATFLHRAKEDVPVVIMNKENNLKSLDQIKNKLLLQGDIQDILQSIIKQL